MTRIYFLALVFLFFSNCKFAEEQRNESEALPNVILIMVDDLGWGDTGFNGNTQIKTPHLDALASQGVVMERFYSASPVCSPTRASVITGRNPTRMGIHYANNGSLPLSEVTLPELLKEKGYRTGHFGKWHLGILTTDEKDANRGGRDKFAHEFSIPTMHGYDTYFCTESKVPTYDPMYKPAQFDSLESLKYGWKARADKDAMQYFGTAYWSGEKQKTTTELEGEDTKVVMDRAVPFMIKAANDKIPFFTTIWPHTPHLPLVADSTHRALYNDLGLKEQLYNGAIAAMDEQIGRLWDELTELGIEKNTIIFFCSDNGPEIDTPGSASGFRGRKRDIYEGGIRVPAFVVWKGQLEAGQRMGSPSVTSDYLLTIAEITGMKLSDDVVLDGKSLLPQLKQVKSKRDKPIGFVYKEGFLRAWSDEQFKLISYDGGESYALYDLVNDRGETNDISNENPELVSQMTKELDEWIASIGL